MPQKNMPENWEPPYPSSSADFEGLSPCLTVYGVQSATDDISAFQETFRSALNDENAPAYCEYGRFMDSQNINNFVVMAYWRSDEDYAKWRDHGRFHQWLLAPERLGEDNGYWIENLTLALERFETLFSSEDPAGAARLSSKPMRGPIREHAYWGGMRDRIALSENDMLEGHGRPEVVEGFEADMETKGKHVRLTAPENLCLIHSAQNWTHCPDGEREYYLENVHPVLIKGMTYLSENGPETNCLDCRFIEEADSDGHPIPQSCGFAYFRTMADLEAWAKSHPTHLAIFGEFHKMVGKYEGQLDLKLWHEVVVVDQDQGTFDYINCHNQTGLMRVFT